MTLDSGGRSVEYGLSSTSIFLGKLAVDDRARFWLDNWSGELRVFGMIVKVYDEAWRPSEEDRGTSCDNDKAWRKPMYLGYASILSAEIWGIYHGLVTAWNLGFRKVELESDSSQDIKIIQMLRETGCNLRPLQHKISCLLASDWEVKATHIPRNANGCPDTIAKHSLASSIGFNIWVIILL
ncbi:ribonuclease H [Senna tora]|uniref:Ribonuclease H n=1 Tax=Senna tora TaxID=362788 RepID=A0A834WMX1_9FABA|nr:ribonuclease H [Senna tora]